MNYYRHLETTIFLQFSWRPQSLKQRLSPKRYCVKDSFSPTYRLLIPDVNVFKSVGNEYSLESRQDTANSIYLTMPSTSLKSSIKVGDVVVGKQSNGFLENVVDVTDDGGNSFVHTELARGGGTIQLGYVILPIIAITIMFCVFRMTAWWN